MTSIIKGEKKFKLFLKPRKERPDFRLMITWLWEDFQDTDTDGDSMNPASKDWTELYISNRENKDEFIDIYPSSKIPLILEISGSTKEMICRVAYFLIGETEGDISFTSDFLDIIEKDELLNHMKSFSLEEAKKRVDKSIWKNATLENPFPNM